MVSGLPGAGDGAGLTLSPPSTRHQAPGTVTLLPDILLQQDKESDRAYSTFGEFSRLGAARSLVECSLVTGIPHSTIKGWSSQFQWSERIACLNANDLYQQFTAQQKLRDDCLRRSAALRNMEWHAATAALEVGVSRLEHMLEKAPLPSNLSEIARILEVASKIGRLSAGLATGRQEHSGPDNSPIRIEFEAALRKIYGPIVDAQAAEPAHPSAPNLNPTLTLPPPQTN